MEHMGAVPCRNRLRVEIQSSAASFPPEVETGIVSPGNEVGILLEQHLSDLHQLLPRHIHPEGVAHERDMRPAGVGEQTAKEHADVEHRGSVVPCGRTGEPLCRVKRAFVHRSRPTGGALLFSPTKQILEARRDVFVRERDERLKVTRLHAEQGSEILPVLGEVLPEVVRARLGSTQGAFKRREPATRPGHGS